MSIVGVVVGSEHVVLIEGAVGSDGLISLIKDETFDLEDADRHHAYAVMHRRIVDRFGGGKIEKVVVKASSGGKFAAKQGVLHAAELRGVVLSAIPDSIEVVQSHKKTVSRDFGSRKVDEYLKDDKWWAANFKGDCRKGSREAAFLIMAAASEE